MQAHHGDHVLNPARLDRPCGIAPFLRWPLRQLIAAIAVGALLMLGGIAGMLLSRRFAGALETAPEAFQLLLAALMLLALAAIARSAWSLFCCGQIVPGRFTFFQLTTAMTVVASGAALSFSGSPLSLRIAFWTAIVVEEAIWIVPWQRLAEMSSPSLEEKRTMPPVQAEACPHVVDAVGAGEALNLELQQAKASVVDDTHVDADRESALLSKLGLAGDDHSNCPVEYDEELEEVTEEAFVDLDDTQVIQQLTRRRTAEGQELISGVLRVEFGARQKTERADVAFCPPLSQPPTVDIHQIDGPDARILPTQLLTVGARFEVKLKSLSETPQTLSLMFDAAAPVAGGLESSTESEQDEEKGVGE